MNRLYHPGPLHPDTTLVLSADASHHALSVLRLRQGAAIELFNGSGQRYPAEILSEQARGMTVQLGQPYTTPTESPLWIGLAQALPAGDKMDWVIEKATELGVQVIQPLLSDKSRIKLEPERAARRWAHWQRIAIAACMQCGRDRLPEIAPPQPLTAWLTKPPAPPETRTESTALKLWLSPRDALPLRALECNAAPSAVWLLAGPEGGWSPAEERAAQATGWQATQLGPRILRSETAGLAALAALQARWGDF